MRHKQQSPRSGTHGWVGVQCQRPTYCQGAPPQSLQPTKFNKDESGPKSCLRSTWRISIHHATQHLERCLPHTHLNSKAQSLQKVKLKAEFAQLTPFYHGYIRIWSVGALSRQTVPFSLKCCFPGRPRDRFNATQQAGCPNSRMSTALLSSPSPIRGGRMFGTLKLTFRSSSDHYREKFALATSGRGYKKSQEI